MQFTFKTEKPTGKWKAFQSDQHYIKFKGKEVGEIGHEHPFTIRLMVIKDDINEDKNTNCKWKWIKLSKKSESLMEAKDFLNNKIDSIMEKYNLHLFEY